MQWAFPGGSVGCGRRSAATRAASVRSVAVEHVSRTLMNAEDLLAMPGDACRELIEGELREMNPAGGDHGTVAIRIGRLIDQYAEVHGGRAFAAETGFKLASDPDTVRAPDAAYVDAEHARRVGRSPGFWPGAPDLAVEVVSPTDSYSDLHEKALQWLAAGAGVVLVCDPASRRVTRYRPPGEITVHAGAQTVDCSPAAPGFTPAVETLLPDS